MRRRGSLAGLVVLAIAAWVACTVVVGPVFVSPPGPQRESGRREAVLGGLLGPALLGGAAGAYDLPDLPYDYAALEPIIDTETMKLHHDKHHATYVKNVNAALEGKDMPSIAELQKGALKAGGAIRNSGGGVYNHDFFWQAMAPKGSGGAPSEKLAKAIDESFGSMDDMKKKFASAGATRFGSGWAWLVVDGSGKLQVTSTPNQDNPLMEGADGVAGIPILGIDVWEHAYYLKYQNRRPDYINSWWEVVNWKKVSSWYDDALGGKAASF